MQTSSCAPAIHTKEGARHRLDAIIAKQRPKGSTTQMPIPTSTPALKALTLGMNAANSAGTTINTATSSIDEIAPLNTSAPTPTTYSN